MTKFTLSVLFMAVTVLLGCNQGKSLSSFDDPFDAISNRYLRANKMMNISDSSWRFFQGSYRIAFDPDVQESSRAGRFVIEMSGWVDPLCPTGQVCVCSGIVGGSYSATDATKNAPKQPDGVYNPLDPVAPVYIGENEAGKVPTSFAFDVRLVIDRRALSASCQEQLSRTLTITIFEENQVLIQDGTRYVLVPVIY